MNKRAFLDELNRLTGSLSGQERARISDYYGEMIDDRMEEGMSEEEAVAALGEPEALARELAGLNPPPKGAGASETVPALLGIRIRVGNADVALRREPIDNGAAAQLRFSDPNRFEWRMEDGTMVIEERRPDPSRLNLSLVRRLIAFPSLSVTVVLSGELPGALDFASGGGNLTVENLCLNGGANLHSASGDIRLSSMACGASFQIDPAGGRARLIDASPAGLRVHTSSGDIEATDLRVNGAARFESASGDVELRGLSCGELVATTASGDIEIDRGNAGTAAIRAASGDVRLDELEADPTLRVETASGDIELTRCIARQTHLKTVNGDVTLRLEDLPCGYDIAANTVSGDVRFSDGVRAQSDGPRPQIVAQTVSGDIEARIVS